MAVEIPVFIDIDQAFKEAASRVPQAMKPLQGYMDQNALYIRVKIDGKQTYIKDILDDSTMSARQLNQALEQVNAWISSRAKAGGYDLWGGLTQSEKLHLQVLGALEHRIHGVSDASAVMAKIYTANIEKTKAQIASLTTSIDSLTRKQNQYYKTVDGKRVPGGKAYERTKNQIAEANTQLVVAKKNLAALTVELSKITSGGATAAAAVGAIRTPAMEMAEAWRRGATYVDRWNQSLGGANSRMATLIKSSLSLIALHSATRFVRNIREVTSEFEMQRVALGGIIQDTDRAEQLFNQLKAAAIKSPFEIKDLVSFTKQLSAYRIETDKLFDVTMRLADISAGLGVDMNRLVLAYGQVRAASVLRGQELRQFTEAGIPLVDKLADKFSKLNDRTVTTAEVFDLISKRAVPFRMIEEIFNDMTSAGGEFYRMQELQSETLKGQWMKLKDALSIMYDEIGNTRVVHGAMETLLKDAMDLLQNWRQVGRNIGIVVTSLVAYKVAIINARIAQNALTASQVAEISALELNVVGKSRLIAALAGETAATKAQIVLGNLYVKVKTKEMMATNLFTKSLYRMAAALLSNPYAIAIAGATALIALLFRLTKKTDEATISANEFQKSIESFTSNKNQINSINALCDKYDELSAKADKTSEEQERLNRVTRELAKAYPAAVSGTDQLGNALEINTNKIRTQTKEEEKLIRKLLERKKIEAEGEIERLVGRRQEINDIARAGGYYEIGGTDEAPERVFHQLTEDEMEKLGIELTGLIKQIGEFTGKVEEADKQLQDLVSEPIGPALPDFFGNAWKMQLNSYTTTLESTNSKTKAFSTDQIEQFENTKDALDAVAKAYNVQTSLVDFYSKALENATGRQKEQLTVFLSDAKAMQNLYSQILTDYNAWSLINNKRTTGTRQTDPFITRMQERMKFMQDFKKGYDDLRKYMTSSQALSEEAGVMLGRGTSLGMSAEEQARAASDLGKWYDDAIKAVQDKLKAKGVKGVSVTDFLGIDTTKKSKDIQDLQKLLQSLWDAKTDFDISQKKEDLEDALKKLSDEIKRSETARNFYNDILDLTGDEQLAATLGVSIYGDVGSEFKDRLQAELNKAMETVDASAMTDELRQAFSTQNFSVILANLDKFPEEWQKRLKEMAASSEKFQADRAKELVKALERAKTYGEQRVEIAKKTAQRTAQIQAMDISDNAKKQLLKQNAKKEAEDSAKLAYEAFKDTPMYIELFADLDAASGRMLRNMRENLEGMKQNWKDLHPRELKELQSRLNELDEQIARRNPFKALVESIKQYRELQKQQTRAEADQGAIDADARLKSEEALYEMFEREYHEAVDLYGIENGITKAKQEEMEAQAKVVDAAKKEAEEAQDTANSYRNVAKHIEDAAEKMQDWAGYVSDSLDGIGQIVSTFASDDASETFDIIAEGIGKTIGGAAQLGKGIAELIALNPQGIVDTIQGLGSMISGIFGTKSQLSIKAINKKIDEQDRLLSQLSYSYGRLEAAMAKAFGSDYIYNYTEQLKNLQAQQAAYEKQAELESQKGKKKKDEQKIEEYMQSAKEVEDQILEMRGKLAEFFAGTDLTSAAEDFANAWIEAYMEFGSTTDAISEKFKDMVNNMIVKSLAGAAMQNLLKPVFDEIDALAIDGELTAADIGRISAMATAAIPQINDAMTGLMNNLTTAGIDLRTHAGQFTGISRDIAGASEESILGLSAAVNTANFYISHVPAIAENVAAIRGALVGDTPANVRTTASEGPSYEDQMLGLVGSIPQMRDDMAAMRSMLEKVIKPVGVSATHYVAVR